MSELLYKYNPGDVVWIKHDKSIKECVVCRCVFEIDPTSSTEIIEEKLYHLDLIDDKLSTIIIKYENEVHETAEDAILENSPTLLNYSLTYDYDINDVVWSYTGSYLDIEAEIKQITINIGKDLTTEILYHILPTNGEYSTLIQDSSIVFATQQEALDAIAAIITPTPTMTVTPTFTPTVTPPITQTITPTMDLTPSVTPNPTVTPTLSG